MGGVLASSAPSCRKVVPKVFFVELAIFSLLQAGLLFAFYRLVVRPLPGQVNNLLYKRHVENDFTEIAKDTADLVRTKLMLLESERLDAIARYEALKGKRLNTTDSNERRALKSAIDQLGKQIDGLRTRISAMYAPEVLSYLRRFEEIRLVAALNRFLDEKGEKR
jgi:hypothetical protein